MAAWVARLTDSTKDVSVTPTSTGTRPFTCLQTRFDQLVAQTIAQAGRLAGRPQNEKSMNAAIQQMLDQPLQAGGVQRVAIQKRCNHGRNDSAQRSRQAQRFHGRWSLVSDGDGLDSSQASTDTSMTLKTIVGQPQPGRVNGL